MKCEIYHKQRRGAHEASTAYFLPITNEMYFLIQNQKVRSIQISERTFGVYLNNRTNDFKRHNVCLRTINKILQKV